MKTLAPLEYEDDESHPKMQSESMNGPGNHGKVARNDPCPCGSAKKFKKCCGSIQNAPPHNKHVSWDEVPEKTKKAIRDKLRQEAAMQTKFGELKPMIHADFHGHKIVAVGNRVHWATRWKTFHDFLMDYIRMTLGEGWGNSEIVKPFEERHQILQWYDRLCQFRRTLARGEDGLIGGVPNGITLAYMLLAFDLYVLRHHLALQKKVVSRLKAKDGFQGARYELFVAATFIKAGFDIEYENEGDLSCKHPEFIAKHRETGQQVSVEAKSRHRPGILGFSGSPAKEEGLKAGVKGLLEAALEKPTRHPYVVFIDLNLPPCENQVFEAPWFKEVVESATRAGRTTETEPSPINQLVFTNHPFHYGKDGEPAPEPIAFSAIPINPKTPIAHPHVLKTIHEAAQKFGHIPQQFE